MISTTLTEERERFDPGPSGRDQGRAWLVGALVVAGWLAHDAAVFARAGDPGAMLELLPGVSVTLLLGAALGALCGRSRWLLGALLLASAVAALLPRFVELELSRAQTWFPRALFALVAAFACTRLLARSRFAPGAGGCTLGLGFALGALACVTKTTLRHGADEISWPVLLGALGLAVAAYLPKGRTLLSMVILGAASLGAAWLAMPAARASRGALPPPATSTDSGRSVILVVLDTVRASHLAPYGYERETTPELDRFVREDAMLFTDGRSTCNWTLPSHASLFTGLLPAEHGSAHGGANATAIRSDVPTLAERLRERGYQTAAIVANTIYLKPKYGIDRGFEHFDDRRGSWVKNYLALPQLLEHRIEVGHAGYRNAEKITDATLEWLDEERREGDFFLMLNYMDAHTFYIPPPPFDRAFADERPVDPLNPEPRLVPLIYDRELLYLDSQLGRLFEALRERGLWKDTLLIVTSDHGESLGERGIAQHGWVLYDELVHVPLYVKPAGGREREIDRTPTSGADVHDLILRHAGWELPERGELPFGEWYPTLGKHLEERSKRTGLPLARNLVAWMEGRRKIIVGTDGSVEVYDLDRDPGEEQPLELSGEALEAALARAREWWEAHPVEQQEVGELDRDSLERMRALGYLGDE